MAERWFNVKGVDGPMDTFEPKYFDLVEHGAGFKIANSSRFVAKFYADEATLDEIAAKEDADEIDAEGARNIIDAQYNFGWTRKKIDEQFAVKKK